MKKRTTGLARATPERKVRKMSGTALTVSRPALVVGGSDAEFRALIEDLIAYGHRLRACRNAFAAILGVSGMQYETLVLVSQKGGLSIGEVAGRLHCTGAFITIESNKLVERGILEKTSDPLDGRRVVLRMTPVGGQLLRRLAPYQQRVNDVLFESLDGPRFRQARKLLRDLVTSGDRAAAILGALLHEANAA